MVHFLRLAAIIHFVCHISALAKCTTLFIDQASWLLIDASIRIDSELFHDSFLLPEMTRTAEHVATVAYAALAAR